MNLPLRSTSSPLHTSTVTISGLFGSLTPSTTALGIRGKDAHRFGDSALWNATLGHVVLSLAAGHHVERDSLMRVSFALSNGAELNDGQQLYVSALLGLQEKDGIAVGQPKRIRALHASGEPILKTSLIAEFYIKAIGQDNEVNSAVNSLEITLAANIPLREGFKITVAPLHSATPYTTIPLLGPYILHLGDSASYNPTTGSLVITVVRKIEAASEVVVSVRLQNRRCGLGCQTPDSLTVAGSGEELEPFLFIPPSPISNPHKVLQGGNILRWRSKHVRQSSAVRGSITALTFSLQPSAPIFAPSTITIKGLRHTQERACQPCALPSDQDSLDRLAGLGCSPKCTEEQPGVLALFEDASALSPHSLFQFGLGVWDRESGTLLLQVAPDAVMSSDTSTNVTIVLRNSGLPRPRAECEAPSEEAAQECLTVEARAQLCNENLPAWKVGPCAADMSDVPLSYDSTQALPEADLTKDKCGTCVRHADVVALHQAIKDLHSLVLQPTDVWSPSVVQGGLLRAIDGVPAGGSYTVQLQVTNWIGETSLSKYRFSTSQLQPMVYLEGLRERFMTSDKALSLSAVGTSAWCYAGSLGSEALEYSWSSRCVSGPCALAADLAHLAPSTNTRFLNIPPGSLTASCTFEFTCQAFQRSIDRAASDSILVHVLVRPVQARISGVGDDGIVSSTTDSFLSIALSWDPEQATTGFHPAHGLEASWRVEEVVEQPYCPLADVPLPPTGGIWDACPQETRKDGDNFFYHVPASAGSAPTIGLNTTMMRAGLRIKVTMMLSRDISKLPSEILTLAQTAEGYRWNVSDVQEWFGSPQETSIKVDLAPGAHYQMRILPCDPILMGQPGACHRKTSAVNANVRNAWSIEISDAAHMSQDEDLELEYNWYIDRPIVPLLVPPVASQRSFLPSGAGVERTTSAESHASALARGSTMPQSRARASAGARAHALQAWSALRRKAGQLAHSHGLEVTEAWRLRIHGEPRSYMISPTCSGARCTIVLDKLALIPGQTYLIRLTVHSLKTGEEGRIQRASLLVPTLTPPSGGSIQVSPSRGTVISTNFELRADGWATSEDSLPLTYTFGFINWNLGTQSKISTGGLDTTITPLAVGNPAQNDELTVTVRVDDIQGATATARGSAKVSLPVVQGKRRSELMTEAQMFEMCDRVEEHINGKLTDAINDADVELAQHLISSLVSMLSASQDACSQYASVSRAPPTCSDVIVRRQGLRFRLLLKLDNANLTQQLTATSAAGQASALEAICGQPAEMDANLLLFALRFVEAASAAVYFLSVDTEAIAESYAQVLDKIIIANEAQDMPLYASRRHSHASASSDAHLQRMHAQTQRLLREAEIDRQRIRQRIILSNSLHARTRSVAEEWISSAHHGAQGHAAAVWADEGRLHVRSAELRQSVNPEGEQLPREVFSARLIALVCSTLHVCMRMHPCVRAHACTRVRVLLRSVMQGKAVTTALKCVHS